ncbi:synaptonemal complex central element protein 2-like [Asterias amurensis]|uniref:synaptonemal complex central element protein 2-like n=1 Tax=Asterias amurensis TaxID=7602 RepID=UPI003AB656B5
METTEGCSLEKDVADNFTNSVRRADDCNQFDPDKADFLQPSVPTESARGSLQTTSTDPPKKTQVTTPEDQLASPAPSYSITREFLNEQTQQLIDDINAKRKRDTTMLADFKKALDLQASNSFASLEQAMYQVYQQNSKGIQDKLQELFSTLDRISKLEMELEHFKHSLGSLYSDIHGPARPT